jgi:hypothetical protein
MQVFFIGVLFVFIIEILKKLARAWQIGAKITTTLQEWSEEASSRRDSFLTSCFAGLQDRRYAAINAKSIQ